MSKIYNLVGETFGELEVIEKLPPKNNRVVWLCQCSCGNLVEKTTDALKRKDFNHSCGCTKFRNCGTYQLKDLAGETFGRLKVLQRDGKIRGKSAWLCLCECGNTCRIHQAQLTTGITQSCGCLHRDVMREVKSGSSNNNWNGGVSELRHQIRHLQEYINWRKAVFERDHYTCRFTKVKGGKLHAHHIEPFHEIIEKFNIVTVDDAIHCDALWDTSNGITLSEKAHKKFHKLHGCKWATKENFINWLLSEHS